MGNFVTSTRPTFESLHRIQWDSAGCFSKLFQSFPPNLGDMYSSGLEIEKNFAQDFQLKVLCLESHDLTNMTATIVATSQEMSWNWYEKFLELDLGFVL